MINEYHFGSIIINGKTYNHDVEVWWSGEVLKWWRGESHIVDTEDVKRAVEQNPEVIVIGTGESGIAKVTEEAQKFIKDYNPPTTRGASAEAEEGGGGVGVPLAKGEGAPKGIELIIDVTGEAVKTFNILKEESKEEEGKQKKVIGLFHLTC